MVACYRSNPFPIRRPEPPKVAPQQVAATHPVAGLNPQHSAIFRALETAADNGDLCPTNSALAEMSGLKLASGTAYVMTRLEEVGLIKSERVGRFRVVTIVATGKKTMHPSNRKAVRK